MVWPNSLNVSQAVCARLDPNETWSMGFDANDAAGVDAQAGSTDSPFLSQTQTQTLNAEPKGSPIANRIEQLFGGDGGFDHQAVESIKGYWKETGLAQNAALLVGGAGGAFVGFKAGAVAAPVAVLPCMAFAAAPPVAIVCALAVGKGLPVIGAGVGALAGAWLATTATNSIQEAVAPAPTLAAPDPAVPR